MNNLFQQVVGRFGSHTAVIYKDRSLTYQELDDYSSAVAAAIVKTGHTPDECPFVGIYSSRSIFTIAMMIGVWKAGFAYVPMDPRYSKERIDYIIGDCNLQLILADTDVDETQFRKVDWLRVEGVAQDWSSSATRFSSPYPQNRYAYAIYTSGTTGQPKGTPITHAGLRNLIEVRKDIIPPAENTTELCLMSIAFDFSVWEMFPPLLTGTTLYFISEDEKSNPDTIVDLLVRYRITSFSITPTHLSILPYRELPDLKYMSIGGEPCPQELISKWENVCTLINVYGPTEATVFVTSCLFSSNAPANDIGVPFPGVRCHVLDEHCQPVADGEHGELFLGGIQVTDGYLNKDDINRQKFIDNPFATQEPDAPRLYATGDIVFRQANGHLIYCGRKDNQVKVHGFRIELGEIKTALERCDGIETAAVEVVGTGRQKSIRAYYTTGGSAVTPQQLKAQLESLLPYYMVPARLIKVDVIPKNINGKIDFKALGAKVSSLIGIDHVNGPIEQEVASIWHEVLGHDDSICSDSNFLEIGGDSITVIIMMQKVNERFGLQLTVDDVYSHLDLCGLSKLIMSLPPSPSERGGGQAVSHIRLSQPPLSWSGVGEDPRLPLPSHLQNLYLHCQVCPQASMAYNLVELIPFGTTLSKERLLQAWNALLQSHDALRMTFSDKKGRGCLQVHSYEEQADIPVVALGGDDELKSDVLSRLSQPYDLSSGPLYATVLYRLADRRWVFAVFIHHLIADGWSLNELSRQLYQHYQQPSAQPVSYSFASYVAEQEKAEASSVGAGSRTYWEGYSCDVEELRLPGILAASDSSDDYVTGCVTSVLDIPLSQAVNSYCAQHHITLFSFMFSALMVELSRVSRQRQFTVGYPTSGRTDAGQLNVIGYFVHPRPMKFTASLFDLSFLELCRHVMAEIRKAESYPHAITRLPAVNFTLESKRYETRLGINLPFTPSPLTLTVDTGDESLQCRWLYRKVLSSPHSMQLLSQCYVSLLRNIVAAPVAAPVRSLAMLSAEDHDALLRRNTLFPLSRPSESIIDVFRRQVQRQPGHLALKDSHTTLTYRQLDEASTALASSLSATLAPGSAVGLFAPRSNSSIVAMLAILKCGCHYVPFNDTYPVVRIQNIVEDSGISCMLTTPDHKDRLASICPGLSMESVVGSEFVTPETVEAATPSFAHLPAYIIYTSGTTGRPKGVVVTHSNVVAMATIGTPPSYRPTPADRVMQFNTYLFDASVIDIFLPLLNGASVITAPDECKQDPDRLFRLIEEEQISWAAFPASFLHICHHRPPSCLKTVLVGGDSPSPSVISRYAGIKLVNSYGPTENTVCCTFHIYSQGGTSNPHCIGEPLPGNTCYVLDDDGNPLPDGIVGELYLGGFQLSEGYHRRDEQNSRSFVANSFAVPADSQKGVNTRLYATGDLVCRHADGNFFFHGRKDHQVKIRGYRVELSDIENTLLSHPDVNQCVAEVRSLGTENIVAAHIATDNQQLSGIDLRDYLLDKLPAYMIPASWRFYNRLPLTANGKIDRSKLKAEGKESLSVPSAPDPGLTQEELKCISVVARILNVKMNTISADSDVIAQLGMTSLHVLEFAGVMQERGYRLQPSDIFRHRTIRKIVGYYTSPAALADMTEAQMRSRLCYFTSPEVAGRPLLLVVSGYPYYETEYFDFDHYFKDDYNILVIESANEFYMLHPDLPVNIDTLIQGYADLLRPYLETRVLAGITGLCMGSDIGLRLAVELHRLGLATPAVFVLDGYAQRTTYPECLGGFVEEEGIDSAVNLRRNQIMQQLDRTLVQKYYSGRVLLLMTHHFADEYGQTKEQGEALFENNIRLWQESQPEATLFYLDGLHMELLHNPHDLQQIKSVFDKELLRK